MKDIFTRLYNIARAELSFPLPEEKLKQFEEEASIPIPPSPSSPLSLESQYAANLEVPVGSSFAMIKRQYRLLVRRYHPDRFAHDPVQQEAARKVTVQLNEAYGYFKNQP